MENKELERFKQLLLQLRDKMVLGLNHIERDNLNRSQRDASGDLSGYSLHMADMATDNFDREFSLDIASSEQNLLNRINEAIERLEEGTFGICINCEKPIALKRLKAVPYATLCIKCQEAEEKNKQR